MGVGGGEVEGRTELLWERPTSDPEPTVEHSEMPVHRSHLKRKMESVAEERAVSQVTR